MSGNEEFIQEFLVECEENLDQLDQDLVALEKTPNDPQRLASIFRTIHTIKGTSGFFGFAKLGALAHSGENLLGRLRDGVLTLTPDIATGLLELVDAIRKILDAIARTGKEGDGNYGPLSTNLEALCIPSNPRIPGKRKCGRWHAPAPRRTGRRCAARAAIARGTTGPFHRGAENRARTRACEYSGAGTRSCRRAEPLAVRSRNTTKHRSPKRRRSKSSLPQRCRNRRTPPPEMPERVPKGASPHRLGPRGACVLTWPC